jgi:hypothetical protein
VVSIDTELLWGYVLCPEHKFAHLLRQDHSKGRKPVETLLRLFAKHDVCATWAFVGSMMANEYKADPLHYGRDILERVMSSKPMHEIGCHSFSHIRFSECSREVAEGDIQKAINAAHDFGVKLESFIFPEDKIGHVDVLKQYGFVSYRGSLKSGKSSRRTLPLLSSIKGKIYLPSKKPNWREGIWEIPSSMIFYDPLFSFTLSVRAKNGVEDSIKRGQIFHIFIHPEDFLADPGLEKKMDKVFSFVARERDKGRISTLTMGQLATYLNAP